MRLSRKFLRLVLLAALPLAGAGCSGINSSQSVSPLDFFLPGAGSFLKANPANTNAPTVLPKISTEVASVK